MKQFKSKDGSSIIKTNIRNAKRIDDKSGNAIRIDTFSGDNEAIIELTVNEKGIHIWKEEWSDAMYSHITELKVLIPNILSSQYLIFDDLHIIYYQKNGMLAVQVDEI